MRKFIAVLLLICGSLLATAQSSRFVFFSAGWSLLTDVTVSDFNWRTDTVVVDGNPSAGESFQTVQWNLMSGMVSARFLLVPICDKVTIGVSATPTISLSAIYSTQSLGSRYGANFSVPLLLELNCGAACRYSAMNDRGFVIGAGVEYLYTPIASYELSKTSYTNKDFQNSWFMPMVKVGYRYWSKRNKVKEINLKVGMCEKQEDFYNFGKIIKAYRPVHVGLSFMKILNY
ncbi:MAG: hypothetical protein MJ204_04465 [Bacteroidales bacterium]|nr:hypothetical protein [Bacteroidales bacterium]